MGKNIYLFCSQGMSTSLLAQKMQAVANHHQLPVTVVAKPHGTLPQTVATEAVDVIMLGPQVKYLYEETLAAYGKQRPVILIDAADYGAMNGERVLKQALLGLKQARQ